jgi:biopolymer transport protein ExbD
MLRFGKLHRKTPHVNMIPVINVIFLLLIYCLMQSSIKEADAIPVSAPVSESGKTLVADPLQVIVTNDAIIFGASKIEQHELFERTAALAKESPEKQILLKADAGLDSVKFISILKTIKQAGVTNVYMVTTSPE